MKTKLTTFLTVIVCLTPFIKSQAQTHFNLYIDPSDCKKVHFSDSLNFKATNYLWNFGDGVFDSIPSPTHSYSSNGVYSVIFRAHDSGYANSIVDSIQITINCTTNTCTNFKANYSYAKDSISCGKINFTSLPKIATQHSWSFGDGTSSTNANPSHTYNVNGTYWVRLLVSDTSCSDSIQFYVNVNCFAGPCDSFKANYSFSIDSLKCGKVDFVGMPAKAANYKWDFGNGGSSTSANPSHNYTLNGNYWIALEVFDSFCYDSIYFSLTIACLKNPCASFNADIHLVVDTTTTGKCYLYNNSTGNIHTHFWDFGDGSTSTSSAPTHTYTTSGTLTITYIAQDTLNSCSDTAYVTLVIDSNGNIRRGNINVQLIVVDKTQNASKTETITQMLSTFIYPNPTGDYFSIVSEGTQNNYQIYNMKGQLMEHKKQLDAEPIEINCYSWPSGIYLIRINQNETLKVFKK